MGYQDKANEELLRELDALKIKYEALKIKCEKQSSIIEASGKKLSKLQNDQLKLNEFSANLAYLPYQEIFTYVIKKLKERFGIKGLWISTFDEKKSELVVENSSLSDDINSKIINLLGQSIVGFAMPWTKEQYENLAKKAFWTFSSIHELTQGVIPDQLGKELEKIIGIEWINGIPLMHLGKLVGTIVIVGDSEHSPPEIDEIMPYTGITSNAIGRKKAEEALAENKQNYSEIFNASNDALVILDTETYQILDVNKTMLQMYGYSSIQEIQQNDISSFCADDWEQIRPKVLQEIQNAKNSKPAQFSWKAKKKDGSFFWVEISLRLAIIASKERLLAIVSDISERKVAEEALNKSESQFRNMFETMPNGYYRSTPEGYFVEVNPAFVKMLGYSSKEELLSVHIPSTLYVEESERDEIITENQTFISAFETYRLKTKDGRIIWLEDNARYIKDENGNTIYNEGICRDITERKMAESSLRKSEERFRQMADLLPQTVFEIDLKGTFIFVNKEAYEVFGYTIEDFNKGINVLSMLASDEHQRAKENIHHIYSGITLSGNEYKAIKKDGTEFPALIYSSPIIENGKPVGIRGILVDISENKKAEESISNARNQLQGVLDAAIEVSIIATDATGTIVIFNKGAEKMLGYKAEEIVGLKTPDLFHLKSEMIVRGEELSHQLNKKISGFDIFIALANNQKSDMNEWTYVRKDGTQITVNLGITAVKNNKNELIGYLGIANDITEQKNAESTLRESEYKFKSVFETSSDAIFIMNESIFLDCNSKTSEIFGCEKELIIGHSPAAFSPEFQPDGKKSQDKAMEKTLMALKGESQFFEWIHKKLDGTDFHAEVSLNRIMIKGEYLLHAIVRDISERKKAENEIRESEKKYRSLMESLNEAVMFVDNDDRIKFVNKRFTELLGYHADEIIGKIAHETLLDQKDYEVLKKVNNERTKGLSSQYELEFIKKDGSKIEFLISGAPLFDKHGNIVGSIGTMTDISERKKIEQALIESEEKFRSIVQALNDSITIVNTEGKVTYQSLSATKTFGYELDEIEGENLLNYFHPDDIALAQKELAEVYESANDGLPSLFRIKHKKGHYVYIEAVGINMIANKAINGIVFVSKDVSDRIRTEKLLKNSEERYRITIEQTGQLVYDLDLPSSQIIWSGAVEQLTGYKPNEVKEVTLSSWVNMLHPDDQVTALTLLNEAVSKLGHFNAEYRFKTKNGEYKFVEDNGIVLPDENGKPLRMLGSMKDISDRKKAEYALRLKSNEIEIQNEEYQQLNEELLQTNEFLIQAKKRAEESDRLKTAFLTNISHEIRTPMNGILGFAELLKMPGLSDQKNEEFVNLIEQSGLRMLNIINDIVDIAKIESGQIQFHYQQTQVNDLITQLNAFFSPEAQKKGINLTFETGLPDNRSIIDIDQTKLHQILTNLLKNSLKFTNSGSIHFGYYLSGKMLEFFVKDTGIGIYPEQKEAIFERFIQGSMSLTRNYEGAGLGLSISKSYVEKFGGKIWFESEVGKGTDFFFNLPYNFVSDNQKEIHPEIAVQNELQNINILIVEDDQNSMIYLKEILNYNKNNLFFADNGQEAVEIIKKIPVIHLVLMDLKMPIMDGFEATRQIKQLKPQTIIIAQTAFAASDDRKKALEAGFDDYISKPIKRDTLMSMITKYELKK